MKANPVERFKSAGHGTEVWWDSSPLVYEDWLGGPGREFAEAGLFAVDAGGRFRPESVLDGATTNQPLTLQVIEKYPAEWAAWAQANCEDACRREPGGDVAGLRRGGGARRGPACAHL